MFRIIDCDIDLSHNSELIKRVQLDIKFSEHIEDKYEKADEYIIDTKSIPSTGRAPKLHIHYYEC